MLLQLLCIHLMGSNQLAARRTDAKHDVYSHRGMFRGLGSSSSSSIRRLCMYLGSGNNFVQLP